MYIAKNSLRTQTNTSVNTMHRLGFCNKLYRLSVLGHNMASLADLPLDISERLFGIKSNLRDILLHTPSTLEDNQQGLHLPALHTVTFVIPVAMDKKIKRRIEILKVKFGFRQARDMSNPQLARWQRLLKDLEHFNFQTAMSCAYDSSLTRVLK